MPLSPGTCRVDSRCLTPPRPVAELLSAGETGGWPGGQFSRAGPEARRLEQKVRELFWRETAVRSKWGPVQTAISFDTQLKRVCPACRCSPEDHSERMLCLTERAEKLAGIVRLFPHLSVISAIDHRISTSAIGKHKGGDRYYQYLHVQSHRPIVGIKRIARDAFLVCRCTATANLPETSDAWSA
jgi:hypothetical protein